MKTIGLTAFCLMLAASVLLFTKQIKKKNSLKNPYLIASILLFLIALRMVARILGG